MTNDRVWCVSCQRWLKHDQGYCPMFPDVLPPMVVRRLEYTIDTPMGSTDYKVITGKKWAECVCLIHTCFEAEPKLGKWIVGQGEKLHLGQDAGKMLCLVGPGWGGDVIRDTEKDLLSLCKNCVREWQKQPI